MRIVGQVYRDVSESELEKDATETEHGPLCSGAPYGRVLLVKRNDLSAPGEWRPTNNETSGLHREPLASRGSIAAMLSWLLSFLIDGFAASGNAMAPHCLEANAHVDDQDLERNARPRTYGEHALGPNIVSALRSNLSDSGETESNRTIAPTRPASPSARFWSGLGRERNVRQTIMSLSALDDLTLKDIGLHRSQIESVARYGDLHRP